MPRSNRPTGEPRIDDLLARIGAEGIPLEPHAILAAVDHPSWQDTQHARDWRTYVPQSVRMEWDLLSLATRLSVFATAEFTALEEHGGATVPSNH